MNYQDAERAKNSLLLVVGGARKDYLITWRSSIDPTFGSKPWMLPKEAAIHLGL